MRGLAPRLWAAVLPLLLAGCAQFRPQPAPEPDPGGRYAWLTQPVIALGDTQEHEATGLPLRENDSAIDAYVEVAQRPPEQPLFGRRILEWVIQQHPESPVIHLGDVLDLSCRSELQRMSQLFATARQPLTVLPGNHDGLMFGIYNYGRLDDVFDDDTAKWNRACQRAGSAPAPAGQRNYASKRDFIAAFLTQWAAANGLDVQAAARGEQRISWRDPQERAFVSALEVHLRDGKDYALSFLAQRLRLPAAPGADRAVYMIALDTSQTGALASLWDTLSGRSPGSLGHVRPEQIRAVLPWVREAARNGDIVIFAGHHNWSALAIESRLLLRQLMNEVPHPLVYVSAHTHRGFWAMHRTLDRRPLLELNVSSLTDWPIAYRRFSLALDADQQRIKLRGELMPSAGRAVTNDAELLAAWEAQTCDRAGQAPGYLRLLDRALVAEQRRARGTLLEWLVSGLAPYCTACEDILYDHGQRYQNELLQVLLQLDADLGEVASQLHRAALPAFCGDAGFAACARRLLDERVEGFSGHADLFARKAALADAVINHLDELDSPQAKAYMTCRAVQAAHADFEATPEDWNVHRGEAKRRAEQFFLIEATVGLD